MKRKVTIRSNLWPILAVILAPLAVQVWLLPNTLSVGIGLLVSIACAALIALQMLMPMTRGVEGRPESMTYDPGYRGVALALRCFYVGVVVAGVYYLLMLAFGQAS